MKRFAYRVQRDEELPIPMGLIVLEVDETLERELATDFADLDNPLYVTRIASAPEVSAASLRDMEGRIAEAARLLPRTRPYGVVGYGCTSASAIIGSEAVAAQVQAAVATNEVTNPLRAAVARAAHVGVSRLALLSPYVEEVNLPLRDALLAQGVSTDVFGSFCEASEAAVARIAPASLYEAALELGCDDSVEGVFISCTNIRALALLPKLCAALGKPVFSSNSALAWHMRDLITRNSDAT